MRFLLLFCGLIVGGLGVFSFISPYAHGGNDSLGTGLLIAGSVMFSAGGGAIDVVAALRQSKQ